MPHAVGAQQPGAFQPPAPEAQDVQSRCDPCPFRQVREHFRQPENGDDARGCDRHHYEPPCCARGQHRGARPAGRDHHGVVKPERGGSDRNGRHHHVQTEDSDLRRQEHPGRRQASSRPAPPHACQSQLRSWAALGGCRASEVRCVRWLWGAVYFPVFMTVPLACPGYADRFRSKGRVCNVCVMDESDPDLRFDETGRCSACRSAEARRPPWMATSAERAPTFDQTVEAIGRAAVEASF